MILKNGQSLRVTLPATPDITYAIDWTDHADAGATPDVTLGAETTSGERTILSGPASGVQRQVRQLAINNEGAETITVWVGQNDGATTTRRSADIQLRAGEQAVYRDGPEPWTVYNVGGAPRGPVGSTVVYTYSIGFQKSGTAPEAAGSYYSHAKDGGLPGAWSPGVPGPAGRATDGTSAADAGCFPIRTPPVGQAHLTHYAPVGSVNHFAEVWDFLWANSGLAVGTTSTQTVNSVAFPARDLDAASDGRGVGVALYIASATANAGAITNITMSYTNSDGVSGRTATMASFPATAVAGTVVQFQLQAGDEGVQSIQTFTLGTVLGAGTIHLIAYRVIAQQSMGLANVGSGVLKFNAPGRALEPGVCALPVILATTTGAVTINGSLTIAEVV